MTDLNVKVHTASDARQNFFELLRSAGTGTVAHEITMRGGASVVMVSKEDLEGWMETLDILSNPKEVDEIRTARKSKARISHKDLLKQLDEEDLI